MEACRSSGAGLGEEESVYSYEPESSVSSSAGWPAAYSETGLLSETDAANCGDDANPSVWSGETALTGVLPRCDELFGDRAGLGTAIVAIAGFGNRGFSAGW